MNEPVRVLQVLSRMNKGGAETFIMNVYRNIDRSKVQFDFAVHYKDKGAYDDEIKRLGGEIYYFDYYKIINQVHYKNQWRKFFDEHPEIKVVHGHYASFASLYLGVAKEKGLTTINHCHGFFDSNDIKSKIKKHLIWKNQFVSDYYFTCSLEAGHAVYRDELYKDDKVKLIPNGVETTKFVFNKENRELIRKELNILQDDFVIGHIGRLTRQKNHKFLLRVFAELVKIYSNAKLVLVGDGELKNEIIEDINNLGIQEKVILTGVRSDIPNLLSAFDIFVMPSHHEGLPVTLVEAQANGLKCIVSDKVPYEINFTKTIDFLSLDNIENWVDTIISCKNYDRFDNLKVTKEKGFDIEYTSNYLQKFYLELNNK